MAFVSLSFLIFLAIVAVVYFLVPSRWRWVILLIADYVFFWINSGWLVLVLFGTTALTFLVGILIEGAGTSGRAYLEVHGEEFSRQEKKAWKNRIKKKQKTILIVGIVLVLGILLFLKYYNFFAINANLAFQFAGIQLPGLHLLLPLGISFYTLQAISYLTDVYRGKIKADRNLAKFMLFLSFFPQIVQGPIARYHHLAHQLYEGHSFEKKRVGYGIQLMLWGFFKKLIIADRLAVPVNQIFGHFRGYHGLLIFLGAACYGLQVYADFSGGMDMARGISQIFGIELELNFKQPYFSTSIEDFWRRWHITLGQWMRDYIFYPLSISKTFGKLSKKSRNVLGNYVGKRLPSFLAMFVVFTLVGFWHGPEWKYVAYGIWNGIFIVSGILLADSYEKLRIRLRIGETTFTWRLFRMGRTFVLVAVGRLFSRANGLKAALTMIRLMLVQIYDVSFLLDGSLKELGLDTANWVLLLAAILVLLVVDFLHERQVCIRDRIARQNVLFRFAIYYSVILCLVIFGVYGPEYNSASFIYEQF